MKTNLVAASEVFSHLSYDAVQRVVELTGEEMERNKILLRE